MLISGKMRRKRLHLVLSVGFTALWTGTVITGLGPTGVILGRVVTMGYVGSIVGPIMIGAIAHATWLRAALFLLVLLAFVIALVAGSVSTAAAGKAVAAPAWPGA